MRKYEEDVKRWVSSGDISEDFYRDTNAIITRFLSKKYAAVMKSGTFNDIISEVWIALHNWKQSYLNGTFAWSTFVCNQTKYTFNRHYHKITEMVIIPNGAKDLSIRYNKEVNSKNMTEDEFIKQLKQGVFGGAYKSEKAIEKIISASTMKILGTSMKSDDSTDWYDVTSSNVNEEDQTQLKISIESLEDELTGCIKHPAMASIISHRVLPLIRGEGPLTLKQLSGMLGMSTERVRQHQTSVIGVIKKSPIIKGLINDIRETIDEIRGNRC